ncbi:MAG: hypothetical protein R8K20_10515 [Gallionellaceae bacterium]|jgi:hypothetical protein
MKATGYVIISATSLDQLEKLVTSFLKSDLAEPWFPCGAPVFHEDTSGAEWHQALYEVATDDDSAA